MVIYFSKFLRQRTSATFLTCQERWRKDLEGWHRCWHMLLQRRSQRACENMESRKTSRTTSKRSRAEDIPGEVVGQLARAHEHFTILCWAVQELSKLKRINSIGSLGLRIYTSKFGKFYLILFCKSLGFILSVGDINKVPVREHAAGKESRSWHL